MKKLKNMRQSLSILKKKKSILNVGNRQGFRSILEYGQGS